MTRFDWPHATAWTAAPVLLGAGLGLLAYGLWWTLERLRLGSYTRWTLLELLAIIAAAMLAWWLAALCRAAAHRRRVPEAEPLRRTVRRIIVTPPGRGDA